MATSKTILLLSNASATGDSILWPGGRGTFHVIGTFSGATITLQRLGPDDTTWSDISSEVALTAVGMTNFEVGEGAIRAEVVGGPPSGIYAEVAGIV